MTKAILIKLTPEIDSKIEFLKAKEYADSKARTKVMLWCLEKTYDLFKKA